MADADSLSYSVRLSVVGAYLGQLLLLAAALSALPPLFALVEREWMSAAAFAGASAAFLLVGWLLQRSGARGEIQSNEAVVVVAMIFIPSGRILITSSKCDQSSLSGSGHGKLLKFFKSDILP